MKQMNRRDFMMRSAAAMGAMATMSCVHRTTATMEASDDMAELASHRIAHIEQRMIRLNWPRLVGKNSRLDTAGTGRSDSVAIIHTDRGAMGWGVGWRFGRGQANHLNQTLVGTPVSRLFDPTAGILPGCPITLDCALHDLAGVILNKPVWQLLGGTQLQIFPCYSGMIYMDDLDPPENPAGIDKVLQNCQQDYDLGYRQMKLKVGRGHRWMERDAGMKRDIEVTREVVKAFPDVVFMVDANDGWTLQDVADYVDGIGDIKLLWIEEPFPESVEGFTKLRAILNERNSSIYITDGETNPDMDLIDQLIAKKLIDVLNMDIVNLGFTPWRRIMPTLEPRGVIASPHTWGSRLKEYYTAHLAAAYGHHLNIEGVTCDSDEVDWSDYKLNEKGELVPSSGPGFGMKLLG